MDEYCDIDDDAAMKDDQDNVRAVSSEGGWSSGEEGAHVDDDASVASLSSTR